MTLECFHSKTTSRILYITISKHNPLYVSVTFFVPNRIIFTSLCVFNFRFSIFSPISIRLSLFIHTTDRFSMFFINRMLPNFRRTLDLFRFDRLYISIFLYIFTVFQPTHVRRSRSHLYNYILYLLFSYRILNKQLFSQRDFIFDFFSSNKTFLP